MTDYERRSLSSRTVNIFHIKSYNKTLFLVLHVIFSMYIT